MKNLCIVGCGNMGLIYTQFLTQKNLVERDSLLLIEKNEERRNELRLKNIGVVEIPECSQISNADLILIAVKPQDFSELAILLKGRIKKQAVVISIMAGITVKYLQTSLLHDNIVRAMPNAPALYGKGMTVYFVNPSLNDTQRNQVCEFMSLTGKILEIKDEKLLDAVTALSGSGPAYFFYLSKNMVDSAVKLGMNKEMAELLVKQTLIGGAEMIANSNKTMEELIKTVASRGGTTEAALNYFNQHVMNDIVVGGIEKATLRSQELSQAVLSQS